MSFVFRLVRGEILHLFELKEERKSNVFVVVVGKIGLIGRLTNGCKFILNELRTIANKKLDKLKTIDAEIVIYERVDNFHENGFCYCEGMRGGKCTRAAP